MEKEILKINCEPLLELVKEFDGIIPVHTEVEIQSRVECDLSGFHP
jgi:hypothetical protein